MRTFIVQSLCKMNNFTKFDRKCNAFHKVIFVSLKSVDTCFCFCQHVYVGDSVVVRTLVLFRGELTF